MPSHAEKDALKTSSSWSYVVKLKKRFYTKEGNTGSVALFILSFSYKKAY